jgi:Peptidase A4 family
VTERRPPDAPTSNLAVSFNVTPPDFDVATASPESLARYGIPARPDPSQDPDAFASWRRRFPKGFRLIEPVLRENQHRYHPPLSVISEADGTSDNWSGAVITPAAHTTFADISASWNVSRVWPPTDGSYSMSSWVGIDGWGSNDVVQAGVGQDVTDPGIVRPTTSGTSGIQMLRSRSQIFTLPQGPRCRAPLQSTLLRPRLWS